MNHAQKTRRWYTYKAGSYALFWVGGGICEYACYGMIDTRGTDEEARVWDDNDFGYAPASEITHYADCQPPQPMRN